MVTDNFNAYYTKLLTGLQEDYPSLKGGTVYKETPSSFPYLYFKQTDAPTASYNLRNGEEAVSLNLQVEIYSTTGANDARKISNAARAIMTGMGFKCSFFEPVENADSSVYRIVSRYDRIEV